MTAFLHAVPDRDDLPEGTRLARVARVDRGACDVLTVEGPLRAQTSAAVRAEAAGDTERQPCAGDLVVLAEAGGRTQIAELLPRRTAVVRAAVAPGTSQRQVLAANVDVLAVCEPCFPDPDLGRIERLLALAWESGAQPAVLLTKADLALDLDLLVDDVATTALGIPVIAVSAATGAGVDQIRQLLGSGRVLAMVGASGAGKSTLVNALAGTEVMPTAELRADGKGRHTTAHRELIVLPDGSLLIDTPGLRSVGLATPDSLEQVFADIEALTAQCRFNDCAHDAEPACAVQAAIEDGRLPQRRLDSWRKLQREAAYQARRTDARLRAAERDRWKAIQRQNRIPGRTRR
ncbi:MAG TPA: ribosome small subunit-dependent GTPase A [Actinomycetes bacterium]|nr:ribosome small subunit-dependent GTPase A [Actinomycetes bacterium]